MEKGKHCTDVTSCTFVSLFQIRSLLLKATFPDEPRSEGVRNQRIYRPVIHIELFGDIGAENLVESWKEAPGSYRFLCFQSPPWHRETTWLFVHRYQGGFLHGA